MSEDRFFQNIRSTMVEYRPEVPQSAYTGMRKKLWWSNFTKISATRFNIWYAALIVTSASLLINFSLADATPENDGAASAQSELPQVVHQDMPASPVQETNTSPLSVEMNSEEVSSKDVRKTATTVTNQEEKPGNVATGMSETEIVSEQITSIEPTAEGKKDSALSVGKGVKKGLKVKTFQVPDK